MIEIKAIIDIVFLIIWGCLLLVAIVLCIKALAEKLEDFNRLLIVIAAVVLASCNNLDVGFPSNGEPRPVDSFIVEKPDTLKINKQYVVSYNVKVRKDETR